MTGSCGPVALFGTSADPPTRGHRLLLEGLLELYPSVATWASDNPLKRHTAPLALRTALLQAVVDAIGNPRLCLRQELSSAWAIETLARAHRLWPGRPTVLVIGSDLAGQIPRWHQADALLRGGRLALVPRQGWPLEPEQLQRLEQAGAQVEVLPLAVPASASSSLRAAAATPANRSTAAAELPAELRPVLLHDNPYGFPLS